MVDYSESTKYVFSKSRNKELRRKGLQEKRDPPEYYSDSSEKVPVARYRDKPGYLKLDINSTSVIGTFGGSGSGKTTADTAMAGRTFKQGRIPVNLADTDLHFTNFDNNGGVSKRLRKRMGFYPGEERFEIPQTTLLPRYLYNQLSNPPSNVEYFALGFQDVSESELKFLLSKGLDRNQKMSMQVVLDNVTVDDSLTFGMLRDVIDDTEEIHHATGKKLKRNINSLEESELISGRYRKDVVSIVESGEALSLGMKGFSRLSPTDYYKMEFYAKKVAKLLIDARVDGDLDKPLFGMLPEAHHLMPRGGDSILADLVKRIFTFYKRRADFPMVLDTQEPSNLPPDVLRELNHVFVGCDEHGKPLSKHEFKKVLDAMSVVANPQKDNRRWLNRLQELSHREFLYINGSMSSPYEAEVVEFLAPPVSNP